MANSVVRPHVPEDELHGYCDGELSPPQRVEIAEHLLGCLICRAQHAEIEELRTRTATLLAMAAPRRIRAPARPGVTAAPVRRRLPRITAAAAAAVVGLGVWFSYQPGRAAANPVQTATQLVAPAPASTETDPVSGPGWQNSSWTDALKAGDGSVASLPGLAVIGVRVHAGINGSRPQFVVRQRLADGHTVWVIDGPGSEFAPLAQTLAASGIAMSAPVETGVRRVGTAAALARSRRSVVVMGNVSADSLNALAAKVKS